MQLKIEMEKSRVNVTKEDIKEQKEQQKMDDAVHNGLHTANR